MNARKNEHLTATEPSLVEQIPNDWNQETIGSVVKKIVAGVSVNGEARIMTDDEYGVLKVSSVSYGFFNPFEYKVINANEISRARVNPEAGSIIISRANTPELVGASVIMDKNYSKLFLSDKLWKITVKQDKFDNNWFGHLLKLDSIKTLISGNSTGSSKSMRNISKDSFLSIPIPVPPLPEQCAIAQALSTIDSAIQKTNQLIAQKELRKKWLMQQLLTGKKRLKGFVGEWKRIGAGEIFISTSIRGFNNEELLSATQDRGIIPRNMLEAKVTMPAGETTFFKLVEKGNFVISLRAHQGGLEYSEYRGIVSPAYTVLKSKIKICDGFYIQYFKSYDFIGHLAVAVIGIRDGKQISYDDFCVLKIPYQSFEEQTAIAQILQTADQEIQLLKAKVEKMKEQKKGMMQVLLTGKKRLKL